MFLLQYPDGYLEALEAKKSLEGPDTPQSAKKKRVLKELSDTQSPPAKKTKVAAYKLPAEDKSLIEADTLNTKLWESCTALLSQGKQVNTCCMISVTCLLGYALCLVMSVNSDVLLRGVYYSHFGK